MKRRNLIKAGIFATCLSVLGLAGILNKQNKNLLTKSDYVSAIPEQNGTYSILSPLPFRLDLIDEMAKLNSLLLKNIL